MPIFYTTFPRVSMRESPPPRGSLKPYMQLSTETIITSLESANTEFSIKGMRVKRKKPTSKRSHKFRAFTFPSENSTRNTQPININRNDSQHSNFNGYAYCMTVKTGWLGSLARGGRRQKITAGQRSYAPIASR